MEQLRDEGGAAEARDPARAEELLGQERELRAEASDKRTELAEVRRRSYYNQKVWKRVVVILAGPAMNLLIAFLIVWGLILANGQAVPTKRVLQVVSATPAATRLKPGDRIVSVDGVSGGPTAIQTAIRRHTCAGPLTNGCVAATPATVVVRRDGQL